MAGKVKSTSTRPGDRYLKGALGIAALSVVKRKKTYLWTKHQRITARRGPMRPLVSVEHAMIIAAWHMLTSGEVYREPGLDYYTRRVPAKTKARAIRQLESLGYKVTLESLADTA
jgi:transposase